MAFGTPALHPPAGAADADIKPCRRRPCAAAQRHKTDHTLPQILRVRARHITFNASSNPTLANPGKGLKIPFFTCLPDREPLENMAWVKSETLSSDALKEAIAFCRLVMTKSGQAHFRNDLEWVIQIAGPSAVVLFTDRDIPAFGLVFRSIRRL